MARVFGFRLFTDSRGDPNKSMAIFHIFIFSVSRKIGRLEGWIHPFGGYLAARDLAMQNKEGDRSAMSELQITAQTDLEALAQCPRSRWKLPEYIVVAGVLCFMA